MKNRSQHRERVRWAYNGALIAATKEISAKQ
jgi:hypothetical protein